jgi:membrane-bound lytic murein transglycosylase C
MQYQQHVDSHAARQQVPSALVFAVMETESMFNPTARSGAPAFGLMQLVPTSGAREAYRYLYNEDKIVTDTYLYNPENNIQLGAAYLNRLYHNQLAGITSPQTRLWASIAAYNTGPSNVFRTFAGKYSKSRFGSHAHWQQLALAEINKRTAEQVYAFMRANLPYPETREYVKKVRERMPKYQA